MYVFIALQMYSVYNLCVHRCIFCIQTCSHVSKLSSWLSLIASQREGAVDVPVPQQGALVGGNLVAGKGSCDQAKFKTERAV